MGLQTSTLTVYYQRDAERDEREVRDELQDALLNQTVAEEAVVEQVTTAATHTQAMVTVRFDDAESASNVSVQLSRSLDDIKSVSQ